MLRFLIWRVATAIPVLFVVSVVCFVIVLLVPGDVVSELAGADATPAQIEAIRNRLGLDRPFFERALDWYSDLLKGDLGNSYLLNRSVVDAIFERLPVTLSLAGLGLVVAIVMGLAAGILAAIHHNGPLDQLSMGTALVGISLPDFWLGLLLMGIFSVQLGWLPTGGFVPISESLAGWARSVTLPVLTLGFSQMGVVARMTRSSMLDVLNQDYVRTARAKGMLARTVILKHALRNALIPVVTVVGVMTGMLLGGAVVIEVVFSLPGVGRLIVGSIQRRDFPVIQGGLLITATIFVVINILVDLLYGWLDPRVREGR